MNKFLSIIILISNHFLLFASAPSWSVLPQNYQYQMTLSSRVSIRCVDLNNSNVIVGAFINGECRGVDTNKVLISGYYNTFITIFSNVQSGEKVSFKLYDPISDIVYDAVDSVVFENNMNYSEQGYPYLLMSNYRPERIQLSNKLVYNTFPEKTKIAEITTVDKNNNQFQYTISGTNADYFYITDGSLYLNKKLISDTIKKLIIKITTDDLNGCTYDSIFQFDVINNDPPPTGLVATDSTILEHRAIGTVAKVLQAIDLSPVDAHIFQLVGGDGSSGNSKFIIEGNQLKVNSDIEYSSASSYSVRIKITDKAYNTIEVVTHINIKEILYDLNPTSHTIEEHKPIGTVAKTLEVNDPFNTGPYLFSLVGGVNSEDNFRYKIVNDKVLVNSDIEYDTAMVHHLRIAIKNSINNIIEKNIEINILETINSKLPLKANNLVTPNGDGINEIFEIYNVDLYSGFQLVILDDNGIETNHYNREMTKATKYNNTWNGIGDNGEKLPTGVYYYFFINANNEHEFKGMIYLVQPN